MSHSRICFALLCAHLALGGCASGGSSGGSSGTSSTPRTAEAAPTVPMVEITANSLNVRQEPSSSGAVVGSLKLGDRAAAPNAASDGWIFVQSDSGISGYVSERYVRWIETSAAARPTATAKPAPSASASAKPDYSPAPGSKLASVKPGMTGPQVVEILGAPTSEQNYVTGKAFIPYYYGGDTSRMDYKYAGLGRVVFSRNRYSGALKVIEVHADASEDGQ